MAMSAALSLRLLVVSSALFVCALGNPYDWQWGRATYYGDVGDPANFHTGSCGFGYIQQVQRSDFHVLAIPDTNRDFGNSCGKCFEVKCNPANYQDNWGQKYDRSVACQDPNRVVKFVATDACPCQYNNQWCCGDSHHYDLAHTGFEQLADKHWGTIGILIRQINCPPGFDLGQGFFHGKGRRLTEEPTRALGDDSTLSLEKKEFSL